MEAQNDSAKQKVIDQVTPGTGSAGTPIGQLQDDSEPKQHDQLPAHEPSVTKTPARGSGVGLVVGIAIIVIIGLIALALYAYKKSTH